MNIRGTRAIYQLQLDAGLTIEPSSKKRSRGASLSRAKDRRRSHRTKSEEEGDRNDQI